MTLQDLNAQLKTLSQELKAEISSLQSNHEGELVEAVHKAMTDKVDGILINPAAYGHTSIALRDALAAAAIPFVEVHMSNIYAREPYRQKTYLSDIARGVIAGFGPDSYFLGLRGLARCLEK